MSQDFSSTSSTTSSFPIYHKFIYHFLCSKNKKQKIEVELNTLYPIPKDAIAFQIKTVPKILNANIFDFPFTQYYHEDSPMDQISDYDGKLVTIPSDGDKFPTHFMAYQDCDDTESEVDIEMSETDDSIINDESEDSRSMSSTSEEEISSCSSTEGDDSEVWEPSDSEEVQVLEESPDKTLWDSDEYTVGH